MRNPLPSLLLMCMLFACNEGKPDSPAGEVMDAASFVASFPRIDLPYRLTDSLLALDPGESLRIRPELMSRFVPDTLVQNDFPRKGQVMYHSIGAYAADGAETYVLVRASAAGRTVCYLLCFNDKSTFRASLPVLKVPTPKGGSEMRLDRNLSIHVYSGSKAMGASKESQRSVYAYDKSGSFALVMTEDPDRLQMDGEVYNPIDTLPMKDPMSGNYIRDDKNFVAVRDAGQKGRLHFFIHMERDAGECMGELRGVMDVVEPGLARYRKDDDHCSLDFQIRAGVLTVKELMACGNRRSVKCAFDGSYRRRKPQGRKAGTI